MIFLFAGLGLVLVGTILVGSLVFGIEPRRADDPPVSGGIVEMHTTADKESP
jgi:hypothetical protein